MKLSTVLFVCAEALRNTPDIYHDDVLMGMLNAFEDDDVIDCVHRSRIETAITNCDDVALDGLIELLEEEE